MPTEIKETKRRNCKQKQSYDKAFFLWVSYIQTQSYHTG